jgi:tetratricopeptide (TPR) repeat protein
MSARKARQVAMLLESGHWQFQQGQLEQARQSCKRALELAPRQPDALHLLGIIALQEGDHAGAVEKLRQAVAMVPDRPDYLANLAYGYVGLKRLPEALAAFERAARLAPADPELHLGVGVCLGTMGKPAEAEASLRSLVERHPQHAQGWFNLANVVRHRERPEEARDLYRHATRLAPRYAEAYNNLGIVLRELGQYEDAEAAFRACVEIQPEFLPAYASLAIVLNDLRQMKDAEAVCRQSLARDPNQPIAMTLLGKTLALQDRHQEAIACHERAIALDPFSAEAHSYLGDALARTGRMEEALVAFGRAIELNPGDPYPRFAKAITLLAQGRIREGAPGYRYRPGRQALQKRLGAVTFSDVLPTDLSGKRVCLVGEQGLGDELFFLRYAPELKLRGARVTFRGDPRIASILGRCECLDEVISQAAPLPVADHVLLIGDLMQTMDSFPSAETPPALILPLRKDSVGRNRALLQALGPPPYVGLTWRAGTGLQEQRGHVWSLFKEIPLESLASTLSGINGTLISIQRRPDAGETGKLSALVGRPVHDLSALNEDLEEMLALLTVMDEYVGVSNTNMHLRAATGRTARVLVPCPPEWRWMAAGDESPWFPGFRIYRQATNGNWSPALARLAHDLQRGFGREKHHLQ